MWALPLYDVFILLYGAAIRVAAWSGNRKAKAWVTGRRQWRSVVTAWRRAQPDARPVWMHCASLGEFEQGRPVLEALRRERPDQPIVLSFFSPSGYEVQQHYPGADCVFYLPEDTRRNARALVELLRPEWVLFVKYEFWYHHIRSLKQSGIPLWLISGIFRPGQPFFRWYGGLHRRMLAGFSAFFVQNQASLAMLRSLGYDNVVLSGDTRFDRVVKLPAEPFSDALIESWLRGRPCLVAGSTWPADEELIAAIAARFPELAFLMVPHQVDATAVARTQALFPGAALYSASSINLPPDTPVLIVDKVGMLSKLYRYGQFSYVGGGLSATGIHNVLEPAVYGLPVVHGPHYQRYQEAVDLLATGGSFVVDDRHSFHEVLERLQQNEFRLEAGRKAADFVKAHSGATDIIIRRLLPMLSHA